MARSVRRESSSTGLSTSRAVRRPTDGARRAARRAVPRAAGRAARRARRRPPLPSRAIGDGSRPRRAAAAAGCPAAAARRQRDGRQLRARGRHRRRRLPPAPLQPPPSPPPPPRLVCVIRGGVGGRLPSHQATVAATLRGLTRRWWNEATRPFDELPPPPSPSSAARLSRRGGTSDLPGPVGDRSRLAEHPIHRQSRRSPRR